MEIPLVIPRAGVEVHRPFFPDQTRDSSFSQGGSFIVNSSEFCRPPEELFHNPQGCLISKSNQGIFSSASSLSGRRSGVHLPGVTTCLSRADDYSSRPRGVSLNLHKDHRTSPQLSTQEIFDKLFFPNSLSSQDKIPSDPSPSVPSPSIASAKESDSIVEDSQRDVNTFSGFQDSSVGPVGSSEMCVLPGPSRESLSEYSARVKVSQEGLGMGAEVVPISRQCSFF